MKKNLARKFNCIEDVSPSSAPNLARLKEILNSDSRLRVAVFGKYNHGKSTLLNALIGEDVFKAADKRETLEVSEFESDGVVWIDTPGLDADVHGEDDRKAKEAAFSKADLLCLVHNVKAGELDHSEMGIYRTLMTQCRNYKAKILVVLTQIDQLDEGSLKQVQSVISQQLPDVTMIGVSSVRYTKGVSENKSKMIERSNFDALKDHINVVSYDLSEQRKKEVKDLVRKTRSEMTDLLNHSQAEKDKAASDVKAYTKKFHSDISEIRKNLGLTKSESQVFGAAGVVMKTLNISDLVLPGLGLSKNDVVENEESFKNKKLYDALVNSKSYRGDMLWPYRG